MCSGKEEHLCFLSQWTDLTDRFRQQARAINEGLGSLKAGRCYLYSNVTDECLLGIREHFPSAEGVLGAIPAVKDRC